MRKVILQFVKATFPMLVVFSTCLSANSQQSVIADKDNTHPEQTNQYYIPAKILSFTVAQQNGYNEVQWTAQDERDTRRYIIEYSDDGLHYTTAGEMSPGAGMYDVKHSTNDGRSLLYRIRMEKRDGRYVNSTNFLLEGVLYPPAKIYPTIISTDAVNLQIYFPVQRISIVSTDGRQVYTRNMDGFMGSTSIVLPASLPQGIYFMSFYGDGWKNTQRIVIGTHPSIP